MGIPYLDWEKDAEPMMEKMDRSSKPIQYNDADWGCAGHGFTDVLVA